MKIHRDQDNSRKTDRSKGCLGKARRRGLRVELLEERRVLDASMPSIDLLPNWFETVNSRYEAGFEKKDVYGPIRWLETTIATIQLTDHATDQLGTLTEVETWFPNELSIHVMHGLGKPGQLAVGIASPNPLAALELVRNHPSVASADLSIEVLGSLVPDDPQFGDLHGLFNIGQNGGNSDADVDAEQAWDITTGSLDNVVAVIDSGVDYTHPDLFLNIWINQGEIDPVLRSSLVDSDGDGQITFRDLNQPANSLFVTDLNTTGFIDAGDLLADITWANANDGDGNGFIDDLFGWDFRNNDNDPFDDHRHGTHVAGTIAAVGNNGTGVAGLNWQAQVMPLKFLDNNNRGSTADAIPAIHYATVMRTNHNVNVRATNNSWGSLDGEVPALETAIADSALADILFVAGAGNGNVLGQGINLDDSPQQFFPAGYGGANIISVAAGDTDDTIAVFSNFGLSSVDVLAPGVGILSAQPGGAYATRNGTSMATPHVTGAAMLVWANTPDATMEEVRRAILESVDTEAELIESLTTSGRLNAREALTIDTFAPRASLTSPITITEGTTDQIINVSFTDELKITIPNPSNPTDRIDVSSLGDADLIIVREDNPNEPLAVVFDSENVSSLFDVPTVIAPYIVSAPGGTWDIDDNGTYEIRSRSGEVNDINGNANLETILGTFEVDIAFVGQIDVTTTADAADVDVSDGISDDGNGNSTLRSAIQTANAQAGENTIVLTPQIYTFSIAGIAEDLATSGDLDITDTLTIIGNGATIDAATLDRVFDVHSGATLTLQDITITGGNVVSGDGGGIRDAGGTINLVRVTLSGNVASTLGGAIHFEGTLNAGNVTISGNTAAIGGGISAASVATLNLVNATITDNTATTQAGGLSSVSTQPIHNTIVAANTAPTDPDVSGAFTGSTYNLIGDVGAATGLTDAMDGNQVGSSLALIDPRLGPLEITGGLTATHVLTADSPAIDGADNTLAPTEDQRQFARPLDADRDGTATADIGATEKFFGEIRGQKFLDRNGDGIKQIANDFPFLFPTELTAVGDTLFFTSFEAESGRELWKSDQFGTRLVRDITVGAESGSIEELTALNESLYFAADDGFRGLELWTSDGTKDGTRLVKDINPGSDFSGLPNSTFLINLTAVEDTLFFQAEDAVNGPQLWKSDGTENGTSLVKVINPLGTSIASAVAVGATLLFTAFDDTNGFELWKSEGTAFTTEMVADINTTGDSFPDNLTNVDGTLLFTASDNLGDIELYVSSGDFSSVTKIDVDPLGSSSPSELTNANGTLLFSARDVDGIELWKSEAPYTSATQVADIASGTSSSLPRDLVFVGSTIFFTANDGIGGRELWKSESPYNTAVQVTDLNSNAGGSDPRDLIALNGQLLFTADDGVTGKELWISDGTGAGTMLLSDINPLAAGSTPTGHVIVDGRSFFVANDGINANRLWSTDGTTASTLPVVDISEPGLPSRTIYLDVNENGVFDQGEPTALTESDDPLTPGIDEAGTYVFPSVEPNRYIVRELPQAEFSQTLPSLEAAQGVFELGDLSINNGADGSLGTELKGANSFDEFASSVSSAGDINGDGFEDVIFGAPFSDLYAQNMGAAYLLFGSAEGIPPQTRISELEFGLTSPGVVFLSVNAGAEIGTAVSAAGDMNGDGFDDLAITAGSDGIVYVVFGRASFDSPTFDLSFLAESLTSNGPEGFVITGGANNPSLGPSLGERVSSAGDVNGDGFDDLLVGERYASPDEVFNAGSAYLIFGSDSSLITPQSPPELTLNVDVGTFATSDGSKGVVFQGATFSEQAGTSVSSAGDFNNDGFDDFAIGAPFADDAEVDDGRIYVVYGSSSGYPGQFNLGTLLPSNGGDGTHGFTLVGEDPPFGPGFLGDSVSTGDFNRDGFSDLIVGSGSGGPNGGTFVGPYLIYGNDAQPTRTTMASLAIGDGSAGTKYTYDSSTNINFGVGKSVAFAGDVNDDGFDDLLIGWHERAANGSDSGAAYLVYGREQSLGGSFELSQLEVLNGELGVSLHGENAGDEIGKVVSTAGDINGDGASDILVGSSSPNNSTGLAYLLYGTPRGIAFTEGAAWIADLQPGNSAIDVDFGSAAVPGIVSGTSYRDLNSSASRDAGETGIAGFKIFIDENVNGVLDEGEPSQVTGVDGRYTFDELEAFQTYTIVQIPQPGLEQTFPTSADVSVWTIDLQAGQVITNANFGNKDLIAGVGSGSISGKLWDDVNGDGIADPAEQGIAGEEIFLDLNNNETKDTGELTQVTDSEGDYTFAGVGAGVYTVRLVKPTAHEITTPFGSSFTSQSLTPDQAPQAIASADLNGDGADDLIVANYVTNNLSIFLNNGDGSFADRVNYPTGFGPISIAVADVDGVNGIDLIIGHQLSSFISVLPNNGDATFGPRSDIPTPAGPVGVAVGDIDGTNGIDIVVANQVTDEATVLYNNGNGGLSVGASLPVGDRPNDVTVGQFDNQFGLDFAVVNSIDQTVSIWLNNGGSNFQGPFTESVGLTPVSIVSGDLDADGELDLVVANVLSDSVSVLFGIGNGNFQNAIDLPAGSGPSSVTIADINNDNRPDLLVTNGGADNLAVLKNLGGRNFESPENFGVAQLPISLAWASTAGDFNADGVIDVAVANGDDDSISVLSNTLTDGSFRIAMTGDEIIQNANFGIRAVTNQFIVNTTADTLDANPGDGFALDAAGNTSLRAAIEEANATANLAGTPDTIIFDIPGSSPHVISLANQLPSITDAVTINGTTEPDYAGAPVVQIDGGGLLDRGLRVVAGGSGSTIAGLSVTGFDRAGIELTGVANNTIADNYLGLDLAGNSAPNAQGLRIINSTDNLVDHNVISGNDGAGAFVVTTVVGNNTFTNNFVGTDPDGLLVRPNGTDGIALQSAGNTVGLPGQGNLLSGNVRWGVFSQTVGRGGNSIQANTIGLDSTGMAPLPNLTGIRVTNENNQIGGDGPGEFNVVSGNVAYGVEFATNAATGNTVHGNRIGTDASGTQDLGNELFGVRIVSSPGNFIGGSGTGQGNVISGSGFAGVLLAFIDADNNEIVGNKIGTSLDGSTPIGNGQDGVRLVQGASGNLVSQNQISANGFRGVATDAAFGSGDNEIRSNFIGTNADGTVAMHNGNGGGIRILAPGTIVQGNTISAPDAGILVAGNASNLLLQDNFIGVTPAGAMTNLGMTHGILFGGANVDRSTLISGNLIAHNDRGIRINSGNGITIQNNSIFNNSFIGIDLGVDNVTANDPGDPDTGPNNLQNKATSLVVTATPVSQSDVNIQFDYQVDSLPANSAYPLTVEFFLSDSSGQGIFSLTSDIYTSPGTTTFNQTFDTNTFPFIPEFGTATVTDANGNTSEFSDAVPIIILGGGAGEPLAALPPTPLAVYDALDVNQDRRITAVDALQVINGLNRTDRNAAQIEGEPIVSPLDVNRDGSLTALDALMIINRLNAGEPADGTDASGPIDEVFADWDHDLEEKDEMLRQFGDEAFLF